MANKTYEVGFKVKFGGNLASHILWLEWLLGNNFPQEILTRFQKSPHLKRAVKLGRQVIEEEVYSVSRGEGLIAESVTAKVSDSDSSNGGGYGGITVFLDPKISQAKGPMEGGGIDPSQFSYGAFFERTEFNSFIKASNPYDPIRYRPFFEWWSLVFQEDELKEYLRSILSAMKSRLPRQKSEG